MLTPEEAPLVRPVEPVNSFIEPKPAFVSDEPVLKVQDEPKQSDLFGDLFNLNRTQPVQEPENTSVMHQLVEEEAPIEETPVAEVAEEAGFDPIAIGFEVKLSETDFVFETPVAQFEIEEEVEEEIIVEEPAAEIEEIGLDDDKTDDSIEDQLKKSKERILRLKDLSMKLRTTNGLQELENEPAYKRKQMQLQQVQHSSESQVSRFTLSNDEDGATEIRPNNSFLHDNVD
jgi:cell division protein FtsZ